MSIVAITTLMLCALGIARAETIPVNISTNAAPRVTFGAERLATALKDAGFEPAIVRGRQQAKTDRTIVVTADGSVRREGFAFTTRTDSLIEIEGGDASGALWLPGTGQACSRNGPMADKYK